MRLTNAVLSMSDRKSTLSCTYREDAVNGGHRENVSGDHARELVNLDAPDQAGKTQRLTSDGEDRIRELETRLGQLKRRIADGRGVSDRDGIATTEIASTNGDRVTAASHVLSIPAALPRLRHTLEKVKLFPSSH